MTILVCDDHEMFLGALVDALEGLGHEVAASTSDPADVVRLVQLHRPTMVLLDVHLPGMSGIRLAGRLREHDARTRIVLLTASTEDSVRATYDSRAVDGLVSKSCGVLALDNAIRRVLGGERMVVGWPIQTRATARTSALDLLTDREREVLRMMTDGVSTISMAELLGVSTNTVRTHVRNVMQKLGVHHRTKAARAALDLGFAAAG